MNNQAEPQIIGTDLVVKFKQPDGVTYKQRFKLQTAGYKLAAILQNDPMIKIVAVTQEPRYGFKPEEPIDLDSEMRAFYEFLTGDPDEWTRAQPSYSATA